MAIQIEITQGLLDRTNLIVLVGHDGIIEWASKRWSREEVVTMLRDISNGIERGSL